MHDTEVQEWLTDEEMALFSGDVASILRSLAAARRDLLLKNSDPDAAAAAAPHNRILPRACRMTVLAYDVKIEPLASIFLDYLVKRSLDPDKVMLYIARADALGNALGNASNDWARRADAGYVCYLPCHSTPDGRLILPNDVLYRADILIHVEALSYDHPYSTRLVGVTLWKDRLGTSPISFTFDLHARKYLRMIATSHLIVPQYSVGADDVYPMTGWRPAGG